MAEAQKSADIGMRRGYVLGQLPPARQLDVIAEGLPILLKSADELLLAAESLEEHPRAAAILVGQATEELSKILILLDVVRCPGKLRGGRLGPMFRCFSDHLARSIYAEAQSWQPVTVDMLQEYADENRKSHHLGGYAGEFIMPNSTIYQRESRLYADIVTHEDGEPYWNEPLESPIARQDIRPLIWLIAKALSDMGCFSRPGLDIVSEVWGTVDFAGKTECYSLPRNLTQQMLGRLHSAGLISDNATDDQLNWLYNRWQVPMYGIDLRPKQVPLEELRAAQEAELWAEFGERDHYRGEY